LARWVENHWPISTRTLPPRLGVEAAELIPANEDQDPVEEEPGAPQPHYWLRPRPTTRGPQQPRRQPREPEQRDQPPFRPSNIENLRPEHRVELAVPTEEAYHVCEENKICKVPPAQLFQACHPVQNGGSLEDPRAESRMSPERISLHVVRPRGRDALSRPLGRPHQDHHGRTSGREVRGCSQEGDGSTEHIGMIMDAHRAERCVGAPRKAMGARRTAAARLEILGRDNSHIALPEEGADEEMVPNPRKRHLTSEAARRADECLRFLKRFKADNPELLEQLGAEYQLRFA
uniref:XPC-binding domain-containing protein n=1 Tax=Anisakis simplex TaxID=6269 RepID=A0A0M3K753_ANISI